MRFFFDKAYIYFKKEICYGALYCQTNHYEQGSEGHGL